MPPLADTLADLAHHSQAITYLSSLNAQPAGPFTAAYLYGGGGGGPAPGGVLSLIREGDEGEVRLFKFVGEGHPTGPGGGNKRVEKLDGAVLSPLRDLKRRAKEGDEIAVSLKTAQRLVDDYRPMPRARAHITGLLDAHQRQRARITELERLISEAENPGGPGTNAPAQAAEPASTPLKLSADEALRAEEEHIRALEAEILPHRRAAAATDADADADTLPGSGMAPPTPAASAPAFAAATPRAAPPQTPARAMPNITNSLVHGATPHRSAAAPVSRFSPLRLLGTPRAPAPGPSGLRAAHAPEDDEPRPIFGRAPRTTATPRRVEAEPDVEEDAAVPAEDDTVRLPPATPGAADVTPARATIPETAATPKAAAPVELAAPADVGPPRVEGVQIDLPSIQPVIDKLWETTGDLMRAGLADAQDVATTPESTVKQLHRVAQADPTAPPSPSSASVLSAAAPDRRVVPVTREHIVLAHLYLLMLRAAAPGRAPAVDKGEAEQELGAMCRARGWADGAMLVLRAPMRATGTKTLEIDRKGSVRGMWKFHA